MKVFVLGNAAVRPDLEGRLEKAGHRRVVVEMAEVVLDCSLSGENVLEGIDVLSGELDEDDEGGEFGLEIPDRAAVYTLCYSASATSLASFDDIPSRVVGFSLVPPVLETSVLELARPLQATPLALERARAFFGGLGFAVAEVNDGPGLVAARVVACLANEAFSALAEGVADAVTIDTAMRLGTGYPLGPLEWADLLGLGAVLAVLEGLRHESGEERYRPHPLLRRLVMAGLTVADHEATRETAPRETR